VGKAEEVERVRFPVFFAFLPVSSRERPEFQSRFLGMQFQAGTSAFLSIGSAQSARHPTLLKSPP
jgi:hypothetical protein